MCAVITAPRKAKKQAVGGVALDTLAFLSPAQNSATVKTLKKRAKSKHFTDLIITKRLALNEDSPLKDSYWNSYYCSSTLIQEGEKVTTTYCKNRWCMVCNRIRTAKMINAYLPAFNEMEDPQFLTLTWPNVKAQEIRQSITEKNQVFRKIYKALHKKGTTIKGIKKIECTYNLERKDYHPHFHFILDNQETAQTVLAMWLKHVPEAKPIGQDLRPLSNSGLLEMFKYFTDFTGKEKDGTRIIYAPSVLDNIFRSVHRMQIFRPYGINAVDENECIDEVQSQLFEDLENRSAVWKWNKEVADWLLEETGELLTGYQKSDQIEEMFNPKIETDEQQEASAEKQSVGADRTRNAPAYVFNRGHRPTTERLCEVFTGARQIPLFKNKPLNSQWTNAG